MEANGARSQQSFLYDDRITTLSHMSNVYSISVLLAAQFIYLNLHFIIGATLTVLALLSTIINVIMCLLAYALLEGRATDFVRLNRVLKAHFWIVHLYLLVYVPLFLWTAVIMYQRAI
jgi:hypothetical protein